MSKVYINIPAQAIAGGVESLFQLADAINNVGGESIVIWDVNYGQPIPDKYQHYNIKHSLPVEDSPENWVIYPEVWTEKINTYKYMKKAIWWLSVNNNHGKFTDFSNNEITHFYQSFYALDYLQKNGTYQNLPLFDYIPSVYTDSTFDINKKENIVCYNPVKGLEITNGVKRLNPDINFVPIVHMSEHQIIELLKRSKVYIDFGGHPGRDRIPRESAILGNCILTNHNGSAKYYNDIPINYKYKTEDITKIGDLIRECFNNYENTINDFSLYRLNIRQQKEQLYNLSKQYFI
jgi:hypothetical protein